VSGSNGVATHRGSGPTLTAVGLVALLRSRRRWARARRRRCRGD